MTIYSIQPDTQAIRWAEDHKKMAYVGWGIITKRRVIYTEADLASWQTHADLCRTYSWSPDKHFTFMLPKRARPYVWLTVKKDAVHKQITADEYIKALGLGMEP